jgi:hypothetical protein
MPRLVVMKKRVELDLTAIVHQKCAAPKSMMWNRCGVDVQP